MPLSLSLYIYIYIYAFVNKNNTFILFKFDTMHFFLILIKHKNTNNLTTYYLLKQANWKIFHIYFSFFY